MPAPIGTLTPRKVTIERNRDVSLPVWIIEVLVSIIMLLLSLISWRMIDGMINSFGFPFFTIESDNYRNEDSRLSFRMILGCFYKCLVVL